MSARSFGAALRSPAPGTHTATVIIAHGLGDTGHGWLWAVENLRRRRRLDEVKFILPHAPTMPVTCNGGFVMPSWYDIFSLDGSPEALRRNEDERGILESQAYFHSLVKQEMDAGIPAERIVLGGFSQGGAMAVFSGLTAPVRLAGIVGLSAYLLLSLKFRDIVPRPQPNEATPVLLCHGSADPVVPLALGRMSHDMLRAMGYNVSLKVYPGMGHSACDEEVADLEAFLSERLPPLGNAGSSGAGKAGGAESNTATAEATSEVGKGKGKPEL